LTGTKSFRLASRTNSTKSKVSVTDSIKQNKKHSTFPFSTAAAGRGAVVAVLKALIGRPLIHFHRMRRTFRRRPAAAFCISFHSFAGFESWCLIFS